MKKKKNLKLLHQSKCLKKYIIDSMTMSERKQKIGKIPIIMKSGFPSGIQVYSIKIITLDLLNHAAEC